MSLAKVYERLERAKGIQADTLLPADASPQHSEDPETRLWSLLTTWASMEEDRWTQEAVDRIKDQILDVFKACPTEAEGWFKAWRQANPGARLT